VGALLDFKVRRLDDDVIVDGQALALGAPAAGPTNEILNLVMDDDLIDAVMGIAPQVSQAFGVAREMAEENTGDDKGKLTTPQQIALMLQFADDAWKLLKGVGAPLVKDKLIQMAIIVLDSRDNRKRLAADPEWVEEYGDPTQTQDVPGVQHSVYSPGVRKWLSEAMPPDQALLIVAEAKTLIQWGVMGEALGALFKKAISAPTTTEPNGEIKTATTPIAVTAVSEDTSPQASRR